METVKSADGTVIAYDRGARPPAYRQRWRVLHPSDVCRAQRPQAALHRGHLRPPRPW